jgi:hypothetical protein
MNPGQSAEWMFQLLGDMQKKVDELSAEKILRENITGVRWEITCHTDPYSSDYSAVNFILSVKDPKDYAIAEQRINEWLKETVRGVTE